MITADRNPIQLRDGQTRSAEPCCIFDDLLQRGVLNTVLMDENSDSDDSEERSKVLLK